MNHRSLFSRTSYSSIHSPARPRGSTSPIFMGIVLISILGFSSAYTQPELADSVKKEFLHAWNGYKQYAWGRDALNPLSKKPHDWYGTSLCMTPVDAYDVMLLMGLTKEADQAKKLILDSLSFKKNIEVQSFEMTIRLLGGLLTAYQMNGDKRFIILAEDLGKRLLPVFDTPTGMPYRYVNLLTGRIRDSINNPAEIGTSLIEFGTLSKVTGDSVYYKKAKRALVALFAQRSKIGLVGSWINVQTDEWADRSSHIGGGIDSYYEYLLKAWLLFGDEDCRRMAEVSLRAANTYLADTAQGGLWYGQVDMEKGVRTGTEFGSLEAFFPALLVLSGDTARAAALEESCFKMWNLHSIEPEEIDYSSMKVTAPAYYLRPEIIESAYYLYHATGVLRYRRMGEVVFGDLIKYCRTEAGYAMLKDVTTKEKSDRMESFFFAETLKYLFLLFSSPDTLQFDKVIFNTEAHPIRRTW